MLKLAICDALRQLFFALDMTFP